MKAFLGIPCVGVGPVGVKVGRERATSAVSVLASSFAHSSVVRVAIGRCYNRY